MQLFRIATGCSTGHGEAAAAGRKATRRAGVRRRGRRFGREAEIAAQSVPQLSDLMFENFEWYPFQKIVVVYLILILDLNRSLGYQAN